MRKLLFKFLYTFAFILMFVVSVFAQGTIYVSSVNYDNSSSFLVLNSVDTSDVSFDSKPIKTVLTEENKVLLDIPNTYLNFQEKSMLIKSKDISAINLFQLSKSPEIARVEVTYNPPFNPNNITLKKSGNTLFISFSRPVLSNYYFQNVYSEAKLTPYVENIEVQNKVTSSEDTTLGQINSAFNVLDNDERNFIYTKNNIIMTSKYYIDNIVLKSGVPVISGIGTYSVSKPIYLSNPSRVVFDIPNAIVNSALHNKEFTFDNSETIKIAQFDHNTARVVINTSNPESYQPVMYGDTQRLAFYNTEKRNIKSLFKTSVNMTGVKYENTISNVSSVKFMFNAPLVFSINRTRDNFEIYLYNLGNYSDDAVYSELKMTPFKDVKILDIRNSGTVLKFPSESADIMDVYLGSDGKTLRIKQKFADPNKVLESPITTKEVVVQPVIPDRNNSKKYVVIDAGHGGTDYGAIRNSVNEKDITLDVAKKVEKLLTKKGYVVAMTRDEDVYVSLEDRVEASELFYPDVFVSIHVNSSNSESPNGIETHYYKDNSLHLAKCIHASLLNNISAHDRGLFKSKFYVINHTTAPAVLVEMGFLSNPSERAQIVTESRKSNTAKAIVEGIDEYFKK